MAAVRRPVRIAILTVSDSRTLETDTSGAYLAEAATAEGHHLAGRQIVPDDAPLIQAQLERWIATDEVEVVLTTGGTGITGRDSTPEAIGELLTKEIPGFGELFRWLSFDEIGASTIQSQPWAGSQGRTDLRPPPAPRACRLGWERILKPQLNIDTRPCNFVELLPRLAE